MPTNPIPDCDECNNSRRIWDESNEQYVTCTCVLKHRLKLYLDPIGKITTPPDDAIETLDKIDDPMQDWWINVHNYNIDVYNGIIAYLLKLVFPTRYEIDNISAMHTRMRDEGQFSELFDIDCELFILTAGLDEEYQGVNETERHENVIKGYGNTAKQLLSRRSRLGLPTWFVDIGSTYRKVHDFLQEYNFKQIKIKKHGSNHINNTGISSNKESTADSNKAV